VAGRVTDAGTGTPVAASTVRYFQLETNTSGLVRASPAGRFVILLLPPGRYRLRAEAADYQPQEVFEMRVPVAGRLDVVFRLRRRSDVWNDRRYSGGAPGQNQPVVTFYGPDVDTSRRASFAPPPSEQGALEATLSTVVDPVAMRDLPLAGRDAYTALLGQPAVTTETGTSRGLGLSANGQRATSANYLLDGVENNNYLATGALAAVAPEAIQEYRVSISNFAAEFGRTSGLVANAVTRSGGAGWHGIGYHNFQHKLLGANSFQGNLRGSPRLDFLENQSGGQLGGALRSGRLFASGAFETLDQRGRTEPFPVTLPSTAFRSFTAPGSVARQLIDRFPAPAAANGAFPVAEYLFAPRTAVTRRLGLARVDLRRGESQWMGRFAAGSLDLPELFPSPYPDFVTGARQRTGSAAVAWQKNLGARTAAEVRAGWGSYSLAWERPHPEIPLLSERSFQTWLPGNPFFFELDHGARHGELSGAISKVAGRHIVKAGAGGLWRRTGGALAPGGSGQYLFLDIIDFTQDMPTFLYAPSRKRALPRYEPPAHARSYAMSQYHAFAQDTLRLTPRLAVNLGLRYDYFGPPRNRGTVQDSWIRGGVIVQAPPSAPLWAPDRNGVSVRAGLSYRLSEKRGLLLRAAGGTFTDRVFDTYWLGVRNNDYGQTSFLLPRQPINYLTGIASQAARAQEASLDPNFPRFTVVDQRLRDPYAISFLGGVEKAAPRGWTVQSLLLGSLGRKLPVTDQVNRDRASEPKREFPTLPDLSYRGNQGLSNYYAWVTLASWAHRRGQAQVAYTWSKLIDTQSDPVGEDLFSTSFARVTSGRIPDFPGFARARDSRGERGLADFDQRHNLVAMAVAEPGLWIRPLRGWKAAIIGAARAGFPYTVFGPNTIEVGQGVTLNNRADLTGAAPRVNRPAAGGRLLLDRTAFREPAGRVGTLGRNAFVGPGLYSMDVSLSREIQLRERLRLALRADAYNVLNHTNLGQPDANFSHDNPRFGVATFGRTGRQQGIASLTPLGDTPRRIQLIVRLMF